MVTVKSIKGLVVISQYIRKLVKDEV